MIKCETTNRYKIHPFAINSYKTIEECVLAKKEINRKRYNRRYRRNNAV